MRISTLLICYLLAFVSLAEELSSIDVFYESTSYIHKFEQVNKIKPIYFNLKHSSILKDKINKNMPDKLNDAVSYMSGFMNSKEGRQTIRSIVKGYQGVGEAFMLGVNELPAVVINKKYVVYGSSDVKKALDVAQKKGMFDGS